jgi:hypothetical protein
LALIASSIGPTYDLMLWMIIQYILTVFWFLYYPKDPLKSSRVFGPLVLCSGVLASAVILIVLLGFPVTMAFAAIGSTISAGEDAGGVIGAAVGVLGVYFIFGRRIRQRWRLGADALKALNRDSD